MNTTTLIMAVATIIIGSLFYSMAASTDDAMTICEQTYSKATCFNQLNN